MTGTALRRASARNPGRADNVDERGRRRRASGRRIAHAGREFPRRHFPVVAASRLKRAGWIERSARLARLCWRSESSCRQSVTPASAAGSCICRSRRGPRTAKSGSAARALGARPGTRGPASRGAKPNSGTTGTSHSPLFAICGEKVPSRNAVAGAIPRRDKRPQRCCRRGRARRRRSNWGGIRARRVVHGGSRR